MNKCDVTNEYICNGNCENCECYNNQSINQLNNLKMEKEVLVFIIYMLISIQVNKLLKESEKDSFSREEISNLLIEATSIVASEISKSDNDEEQSE